MRITRSGSVVAVLAVLNVFASVPVHGAPSDLIVSGTESCMPVLPIPVPLPAYGIEWANLWSEVAPDPGSGIALIAPGGSGRLLALEATEDVFHFSVLEINADRTRRVLFSREGIAGVGLVADASGNIYVLGQSPLGTFLFVLSSAGTLLSTHDLGSADDPDPRRIDLASDQCTLYYRLNGVLHRFDVCTGTALPATAIPGHGIAVLPGGDLLVARRNELLRYTTTGVLVRTYSLGLPPISGIGTFSLTAGGRGAVAQVGCETEIREVDLGTGVATTRSETLRDIRGTAEAIVPINGWTAALGAGAAIAVHDIPALGLAASLGLILVLALLALHLLR